MSLTNLKVNSLYILLFIRNHPPAPNDFHWGLYFHRNPDTGGTKYHIKQQGSGWIADHAPTAGVFKSFLLVGLFRIADVPVGWESHLDQTMKAYDNQLNLPGITCRVWVLWVLALLQKPIAGKVILKCSNLQSLENEVKDWGNANATSAANNVQPRPLAASTLCGL
ncbi:uncharacterized protein BO97DRAFT_379735 [Aspergillus homomorphus CBS 101889]|uniref:Uncharacterized protein n=1 Tax=Aspergillus homomorphus (strain CBS 101889) TaxID=1450537 RepID=A0A395HKJ6_ASPHC|nr:hypothetical protein BO97DRAFT_379735 [Aspergillus homomorphus CBS 101889]RAL06784.1 hypothetical protein BO97DRAFT_379735 [Aspergillus homomorphus CBS 101889]